MTISSNNDWDPLVECFVGRADNCRLSHLDLSSWAVDFCQYEWNDLLAMKDKASLFPYHIIEEANEDLDAFAKALSSFGVRIRRPQVTENIECYNSRDLLLPLDNLIIDCPSPVRSRRRETLSYRKFLTRSMQSGTEWIVAPRPYLGDENYQLDDLDFPTVENTEILFEAPNIVRLGNDLLYQVSNTGNKLGYEWLKSVLEPRGYRLHLAEGFYTYSHFDSTVIPLRPGLVMFNATRCRPDFYPEIFKSWDKIWIEEEDIYDIGHSYPNNISPCSKYIGMNVFSINPEIVCVDINQTAVMRKLEKHGIFPVALKMRHARTLMGGFHCTTLDTVRNGTREDYF